MKNILRKTAIVAIAVITAAVAGCNPNAERIYTDKEKYIEKGGPDEWILPENATDVSYYVHDRGLFGKTDGVTFVIEDPEEFSKYEKEILINRYYPQCSEEEVPEEWPDSYYYGLTVKELKEQELTFESPDAAEYLIKDEDLEDYMVLWFDDTSSKYNYYCFVNEKTGRFVKMAEHDTF